MSAGRVEDDNLVWLAFRYANGECTPQESDSFEARLAQDQAACDALVLAVDLCAAIGAEGGRINILPSRRVPRLRAAVAAAAAVFAVIAFGLWQWGGRGGVAAAVALEWSRLTDEDGRWASPGEADLQDREGQDAPGGADEASVPSWLLAAVTGSDDGMGNPTGGNEP